MGHRLSPRCFCDQACGSVAHIAKHQWHECVPQSQVEAFQTWKLLRLPNHKFGIFAPTQPLTTDVAAAKHPRVYARHVNTNFPPHPTQPLSTDVAAAKHPRVYARHTNVNIPPHPTPKHRRSSSEASTCVRKAHERSYPTPTHPTPKHWRSSSEASTCVRKAHER